MAAAVATAAAAASMKSGAFGSQQHAAKRMAIM